MLRFLAMALFFVCSFGTVHVRAADTYRRTVNFEWEPIEGAKYYDIEIHKKSKNGKTSVFKTEKAEWNGKLSVGRYEFRLRSLDTRKVPGEWSGYAELDVLLEPVKILSPSANEKIKASDSEKQEVKFQWQETPGASGYVVEIYNEKNELVTSEKASSNKLEYKLETAAPYTWKVKAVSKDGLESESSLANNFVLVGPKLEKAKIEKPENEFVRELKWKAVDKATVYDVIVAKYNPQIKKWQKFKEYEDFKETFLSFESDWPGGQYRLQLKSKSPGRETSDFSALAFPVRQGERGPAAEYVQTMRKSIDRVDGWFAHASWYASSISMKSKYRSIVGFSSNAVTGTGRLGFGKLKADSDWGWLAIFDAGGYIFENKVYNYFGSEFSMIKRKKSSDRAEIRYLMGAYTQEFPAIYTSSSSYIANSTAPNNVDRIYSKGGILGAHGGVEYWYSMTPKIGFQANAHLYIPVTGTDLPNGGKYAVGDINYSVGVLGSYRYSQRLTGLMGANLRQESFSYSDSSDNAGWGSAFFRGQSTSKVKTSISGVYVNLMAEYSF